MPFFGHKSRREREWEEVRASAQEDLVALGDDIRALDIDISMPDVSEEAKQRYEQALQAYQRASDVFDRAKRPEDLAPVSSTLEEGRYAMAYAKAVLEGQASTGAAAALLLRSSPRPVHRERAMGTPRWDGAGGSGVRRRRAAGQGGL